MPSQDAIPAPGPEPAGPAPAGYVQTVSGRIPAADLGFVLPHEHTGIQLWQIPNRWDYWELTPDDSIVLPELVAYRAAGSCRRRWGRGARSAQGAPPRRSPRTRVCEDRARGGQ